MKTILFLGGTGVISTACVPAAIAAGWEVSLLTRTGRGAQPGARFLVGDINDRQAASTALAGRSWDCVIDFLAFTPEQIESRLSLFKGRTSQYVYISSASAYQKPLRSGPYITESTPLENPFWDYSRNKIACENRLFRAYHDEAFPVTVVRPSLTYGDTIVPLPMNVWQQGYTAIDRMRKGLPVIIPGDGLSPWTITHNTDFAKGLVGLLGRKEAVGEAFHITSDEAPSWNDIHAMTAEAAGVDAPVFIHMASDFIAHAMPEKFGSLLGDKSHPALFDNSKLKRLVPGFQATTPYRAGIARTLRWFDADPARRTVDHAMCARWDKLIAAYSRGLEEAKQVLS